MRVTTALYRGQDGKGQPFALRAASAVQKSSRDPIVRLSDLTAKITLEDGPATIDARSGRYDMDTQNVMIDGPVTFRSTGGYRIQTRDVTLDMKTKGVTSGGPVDGVMPLGTFSGARMVADLNTHVVTLDGAARLHIVQAWSRGSR